METICNQGSISCINGSRNIWVGRTDAKAFKAERVQMRVGVIDKHGAPIPLLSLIRTLTVGLRISLTSLGQLEIGSPVNLELAAQMDMRMGGHIVQGHVDGTGTVVGLTPGEKWAEFIITAPAHLTKYVVAQGSITLDGVSLTVGAIDDSTDSITVWLIPETLAKTNLSTKKAGDLINIEVDILAKYVERLISKGVARGE